MSLLYMKPPTNMAAIVNSNPPMTKRERVLRTFRFEETDRVPLYDLIQNDGIIQYCAGSALHGEPLTPQNGLQAKGYVIGRFLDMTRMPEGPAEPGELVQENGIQIHQERWTSWITARPFSDIHQARAWVNNEIAKTNAIQYDAAYAQRFFAWMEQIAALNSVETGDPAVQVIESGVGLTEIYWQLGWEIFSELLFDPSACIEEWLDARHRAELRRVAVIAEPRYIPIALTYDDIAYKTSLLISPLWLRKHWVPRLTQLVSAWHDHGSYCLFHSDGNLWKILPDLVQAGIDGLNPLEVLASMTVSEVRKAYPRLTLTGGIDVSQLLSLGTPEEIRAACRENIRATRGVGYFLGSTTELHWEIPLPNILAMLDNVWIN
jgi:hypothetical protein